MLGLCSKISGLSHSAGGTMWKKQMDQSYHFKINSKYAQNNLESFLRGCHLRLYSNTGFNHGKQSRTYGTFLTPIHPTYYTYCTYSHYSLEQGVLLSRLILLGCKLLLSLQIKASLTLPTKFILLWFYSLNR